MLFALSRFEDDIHLPNKYESWVNIYVNVRPTYLKAMFVFSV